VLRTRDRRFLREELECFFEACIIPVTPPVVVGKSPVEFAPALRPRIRHSAAAAPAEGAAGDGRRNSDASRPPVRPSTTGSDRSRRGKKRRPLEGITTREVPAPASFVRSCPDRSALIDRTPESGGPAPGPRAASNLRGAPGSCWTRRAIGSTTGWWTATPSRAGASAFAAPGRRRRCRATSTTPKSSLWGPSQRCLAPP
jgi:hypothetical protein